MDVLGDLPGQRLYGTMLGGTDETLLEHLVARCDYVIAFDGLTGQLLKDVQVHDAMLLHMGVTIAPGSGPLAGYAKSRLFIGAFGISSVHVAGATEDQLSRSGLPQHLIGTSIGYHAIRR